MMHQLNRFIYLLLGLLIFASSNQAGVIVVDLPDSTPPQEEVNWDDMDSSDDDACTMKFAAEELQEHLRLITGDQDDWNIISPSDSAKGNRILLTKVPSSQIEPSLGDEGYILKTNHAGPGWQVEIKAAHRIGILYGAYDFLGRLGVRWFAPGELGRIVPTSDLKKIPSIDVVETPDFLRRGFHAWDDRADIDFLEWMGRNRLNYWTIEESDKALTNKLGIRLAGGEHLIHTWYLDATHSYPYNHANFEGDEEYPADPYDPSSSYQGDRNDDGRLSYFEAHPEWFGLVKGKRIPGPSSPKGKGRRHGVNFCTTNPDALKEFMHHAVIDLEKGRLKHASILNAWLLDNATWCECDHCLEAGSPTDRNLRFVHAYDKAIKEARKEGRIDREVRLLFLTYNDVIDPPTKSLPSDFDYETCIATFFPIRRCYVHDLQDSECDHNSRFSSIFNDWVASPDRHYRGQMCVGEYYNISRFKCLPMSFMATMGPDVSYYHQLGARYFHYMHVPVENWGNKALTNWQLAQQLWNVDSDVEKLWESYFSSRYGAVAKDIRRFYEELEPMLSNITWYKYTAGPALGNGSSEAFKGSHLSYDQSGPAPSLLEMRDSGFRCRGIIDSVLAREIPADVRQRIEEDERMFVYGERTLEFYDLAEQGVRAVGENKVEEARGILKRLQALSETMMKDTVSASSAGEHASSPNTLDATYGRSAAKALKKMIEKM